MESAIGGLTLGMLAASRLALSGRVLGISGKLPPLRQSACCRRVHLTCSHVLASGPVLLLRWPR